ncbi:putative pentatricopeptide repeat-containing protein At4g17915 [Ziziphus jujuba]|uniref:Pentatricopeptide repeat-containing protein At4g17915 n=1 Tax=Ziziphus jujuba TaxID=326968 RepID=A0ABM3ISV5_ZIZJJ|nr:putative pentatricopeptide repeat-containing protein At4g17915 [Ziziphus jujuba]
MLNQCVASFCEAKKLDKAEALIVDAYALLGEMKEAGISPDAITYRSLIARDTKRNLSSESMDLLEDMRQQGLEIISMMRINLDGMHIAQSSGLVRAGRMEEANDFKEQMMSDGNIQLNRAGDILGAVNYFEDMNMMGFRSNFVAFNCLIDCFCKLGHIDQAIELSELMEEKDSITYNTMANNLCKAGRFGWASKLITACLRDGIRIPQRTQRAVLNGIRNSR